MGLYMHKEIWKKRAWWNPGNGKREGETGNNYHIIPVGLIDKASYEWDVMAKGIKIVLLL